MVEEYPAPSRRHIAFRAADFDRVLKALDAGRVNVVGGPGTRPHDSSRWVFCQDPDENLLCQVAGWKYVRLYARDQGPRLYARTLRALLA